MAAGCDVNLGLPCPPPHLGPGAHRQTHGGLPPSPAVGLPLFSARTARVRTKVAISQGERQRRPSTPRGRPHSLAWALAPERCVQREGAASEARGTARAPGWWLSRPPWRPRTTALLLRARHWLQKCKATEGAACATPASLSAQPGPWLEGAPGSGILHTQTHPSAVYSIIRDRRG